MISKKHRLREGHMPKSQSGKQGPEQAREPQVPNHSHAWRGSWNRPMGIDERSHHPFTIARMTDHNVRGVDNEPDERAILKDDSRRSERTEKKKAA
jgi:hypothetical protein